MQIIIIEPQFNNADGSRLIVTSYACMQLLSHDPSLIHYGLRHIATKVPFSEKLPITQGTLKGLL